MHTRTLPLPALPWSRLERCLLATFLVSRFWLFIDRLGNGIGFDGGHHLKMLAVFTWATPTAPIRSEFYAYHPPLGFLLARTTFWFGHHPNISVQLVSFVSSLVVFFSLRALLKHNQLLRRPAPLFFLYLSNSLPLIIFLTMGLNLDIIVLALAAVTLYWSTVQFWPEDNQSNVPKKILLYLGLWSALTASMFVKFSGLLLFSIPPLVALLQSNPRRISLRLAQATVVCCFAMATVLPYYTVRYYLTEGTFFPNNGNWIVGNELQAAREQRSADPIGWFTTLLTPSPVHQEQGWTFRDYNALRLADTWRDFWVRDQFLGSTSPVAKGLGLGLMFVVPLLLWVGLYLFYRSHRLQDPFTRLGWCLFGFSGVQLAAFVKYLYDNPHANWGPAKGMYVVAVSWAIGYLLALVLARPYASEASTWRDYFGLAVVTVFVVLTHVVPMY